MTQLETALELAAAGHAIFPCDAEHKRPLPLGSWREHATTNPESIRIWWQEWPNALPAIALPADVVVVDVDPRNGGFASCEGLELPDTRSVKTAGGGAHLYYKVPSDRPVKNGPLHKSKGYEERVGIDIKTAGGYVIAPGVARADGKRYELARDIAIAPAPEWLLVAKSRGTLDTPGPEGKPVAPIIWSASEDTQDAMTPGLVAMLAPRLAAKGQRHEVARAVGGALAASGWSDAAIENLVRQLPADDPLGRVRDALGAAARFRAGEATPGFGALERAGYAPGLVAAMRTMSGGGMLEELAATAEQRAAVKLVESSDAFGRIVRLDNIRSPIPPVPWLVEALNIAPGPPTLFAGYGGLGKSMLVQMVVVCAATGRPLFSSMPVRKSRVLHLDYEQGERTTTARYKRLAADLGCSDAELAAALDIISPPTVNLVTPGIEEGLAVMCSTYDLCVIDSLRASTPGLDENSSVMREPLDMLFRVSGRTGCTFLVIHHARKPDRNDKGGHGNQDMRGTSAINDASQTVIMLNSPPQRDGKPAFAGFTVAPGKVRDGRKFDPFGVSIDDTELEGYPFDKGLRLTIVDAEGRAAAARAEADATDEMLILNLISASAGRAFRGGRDKAASVLHPVPRDRVRRAWDRLELAERIIPGTPGTTIINQNRGA